MKNKKPQNEQESPHCRKCGGTDIDFTYTEPGFGREIHEAGALRQAVYYIAQAAKKEVEHDCDADALDLMGNDLAVLAAMLRVREAVEEAHNDAEKPEAQS